MLKKVKNLLIDLRSIGNTLLCEYDDYLLPSHPKFRETYSKGLGLPPDSLLADHCKLSRADADLFKPSMGKKLQRSKITDVEFVDPAKPLHLPKEARTTWLARARPHIIVHNRLQNMSLPYWLDDELLNTLMAAEANQSHGSLHADTQGIFEALGILSPFSADEEVEKHRTTGLRLKQELDEHAACKFFDFFPPAFIYTISRYCEVLNDNGYLDFDQNFPAAKRTWLYGDRFANFIQVQAVNLLCSYGNEIKRGTNSIINYPFGSSLTKHVDDLCGWGVVLAVSICLRISKASGAEWPIKVEKDGQVTTISCQPGEAAAFKPDHPHWRDTSSDGNNRFLLFWFVRKSYRGRVNHLIYMK